MTRNPYSPPSSKVTDIDTSVPMERPRAVSIAVVLCWVSLVVALPLIVEIFDEEAKNGEPTSYLVVLGFFYLVVFLLAIWVIVAIGRARNWARMVYTVLTGLSLLMTLGDLKDLLAEPWYSVMAEILSTLLDLAVVTLLFTPSANAWYRTRGRRPADSVA